MTIFCVRNYSIYNNFYIVNLKPIDLHLSHNVLYRSVHSHFVVALLSNLNKKFAIMPFTSLHHRSKKR